MQTNPMPEQWALDLLADIIDIGGLGGPCSEADCVECGKVALKIQAAFAEREAPLVGAMKWAGEVSPPVNDFGCVTVDMSLDELNAMRVLAGFKPLPARKDRTHG